jgi:hypothetical protein
MDAVRLNTRVLRVAMARGGEHMPWSSSLGTE